MINRIIAYSLQNKLIVGLFVLGLIAFGIYSLMNISIGAVPDITNNQVQVITTTRDLSTEDVEKFLTAPVELEMANLPGVKEIRSISKFGLSVVTVVFDDDMGTYLPRQLISEKIQSAKEKIPEGFGTPSMGPVSTGLGEIYQYILDVEPEHLDQYSVTDLRTIQDWIVKRQLSGIPGVVEVNTWGGFLKTYEVAINPQRLQSMNVTITEVYEAMQQNNSIAGGGYIEKGQEAFFIRSEGLVSSISELESITVAMRSGSPVYIRDIGKVGFGHATRFGAITGNGQGEKVLGQVMMLKGASSADVIQSVKERVDAIQSILPEGVFINPILDRSELIGRTTYTVGENLILGCLIVIFVVMLLLGNIRSGLVVASVIPLSLLFAISMMHILGVDANLMSLGAIDFGIIIDGSVIIVDYIAFRIFQQSKKLIGIGKQEQRKAIDKITFENTSKMMRSAIFGQLIIIIVFIPILSLTDVEGKMFRPMALTFCFALIGAMILCFTYVPVMSSLLIKPAERGQKNISQRIMSRLQSLYGRVLSGAMRLKYLVLGLSLALLVFSGFIFYNMGAEFVPTLDEGDFVIQPVLKTGMSLAATVEMTTRMEKIIKKFPEVNQVVSRIGAAEVPTDPMSMEESDVMVTLKPKSEWTSTNSKYGLIELIQEAIEEEIPAIELEFTQPIEMRFNELITGVRADLAIKIFGEDLDVLYDKALEIKSAISDVAGAEDITVEKTSGLPQMTVKYDRAQMSKYGISISDLNSIVTMGFAGLAAGTIFEGEKQFDLVIRYDEEHRRDITSIRSALVDLPSGTQLPLSVFADINYSSGPAKISRDDTKRRVVVGVNVRGRDLQSVVDNVKKIIDEEVDIPVGYLVNYGGQFETLQSATRRLMVAVPISLFLIFVLLYFAFNSIKEALIIYSAIPLAAVGGVLLLYFRGMPFSISAGVGFIALFGIAVLNGIVLIEHFKELKKEGMNDISERVLLGSKERLRAVLLTATAAALGFLPMAVSTSAGAEVQRPLATVVIGGLITATILTLVVLPILYTVFEKKNARLNPKVGGTLVILCFIGLPFFGSSQPTATKELITLDEAIKIANQNNLGLKATVLDIEKYRSLVDGSKVVDKTRIYYGYDHNNVAENGIPLHIIGAQQSFKLPGVHESNRESALKKVELKESGVALQKMELTREVVRSYHSIIYWRALIDEYTYLDSLYGVFQNVAKRRVELGESGMLDQMTAQSKKRSMHLKLKETEKALQMANVRFNLLLNADEEYSTVEIQLSRLSLSDFEMNSHPLVDILEKKMELASTQLKMSEKAQLPEVDIALFGGLNSFNNFKWYPGVEAGIALPLWKKSYKARQEAAKVEVEYQSMAAEAQKKQLSNRYASLVASLEQHLFVIEEYEQTGAALSLDLMDLTEKSYIRGEVDLFQYIVTVEHVTDIRLEYLNNLFAYNQRVVDINYLLN